MWSVEKENGFQLINVINVEGKYNMSIRIFAEFQDKQEYDMYYQDMLKRIPKKYHCDFNLFCGRLESTLLSGKEIK